MSSRGLGQNIEPFEVKNIARQLAHPITPRPEYAIDLYDLIEDYSADRDIEPLAVIQLLETILQTIITTYISNEHIAPKLFITGLAFLLEAKKLARLASVDGCVMHRQPDLEFLESITDTICQRMGIVQKNMPKILQLGIPLNQDFDSW